VGAHAFPSKRLINLGSSGDAEIPKCVRGEKESPPPWNTFRKGEKTAKKGPARRNRVRKLLPGWGGTARSSDGRGGPFTREGPSSTGGELQKK